MVNTFAYSATNYTISTYSVYEKMKKGFKKLILHIYRIQLFEKTYL